jgi:hypothetical protein
LDEAACAQRQREGEAALPSAFEPISFSLP